MARHLLFYSFFSPQSNRNPALTQNNSTIPATAVRSHATLPPPPWGAGGSQGSPDWTRAAFHPATNKIVGLFGFEFFLLPRLRFKNESGKAKHTIHNFYKKVHRLLCNNSYEISFFHFQNFFPGCVGGGKDGKQASQSQKMAHAAVVLFLGSFVFVSGAEVGDTE